MSTPLTTATPAGSITPTTIDGMTQYSPASVGFVLAVSPISMKRPLMHVMSYVPENKTSGTYLLAIGAIQTPSSTSSTVPQCYIDSVFFPNIGTFTTKMCVQATVSRNAVAPGVTMTIRLYQVASSTGTSGIINYSLGSAVTGSDVAFSSSADALQQGVSATFTRPDNGSYALGIELSGTTAADSHTHVTANLVYFHRE